MDDLDILLEVLHDLRRLTRELEENANESDKQYCLGQIHGVELAITVVEAFFKEERKRKLLLTYDGNDA